MRGRYVEQVSFDLMYTQYNHVQTMFTTLLEECSNLRELNIKWLRTGGNLDFDGQLPLLDKLPIKLSSFPAASFDNLLTKFPSCSTVNISGLILNDQAVTGFLQAASRRGVRNFWTHSVARFDQNPHIINGLLGTRIDLVQFHIRKLYTLCRSICKFEKKVLY